MSLTQAVLNIGGEVGHRFDFFSFGQISLNDIGTVYADQIGERLVEHEVVAETYFSGMETVGAEDVVEKQRVQGYVPVVAHENIRFPFFEIFQTAETDAVGSLEDHFAHQFVDNDLPVQFQSRFDRTEPVGQKEFQSDVKAFVQELRKSGEEKHTAVADKPSAFEQSIYDNGKIFVFISPDLLKFLIQYCAPFFQYKAKIVIYLRRICNIMYIVENRGFFMSHQNRLISRRRNIPFRISIIYAFFSTLWILFSDRILLILIDDVETMTAIQTIKGWIFIVVTTLLIFNLLRREIIKVKKLEEQLIQSEKMISISNLATGMANQINNPLAGIVQNTQIVRNRLTQEQKANLQVAEELGVPFESIVSYVEKREIERILDSITSSGHNASELIESMLSFSNVERGKKEMANPAQLLSTTIDLLQKDNQYINAVINTNIENVPSILCEPARLQHVFLHILTNALDIMLENRLAPRVDITAGKKNDRILIAIADRGPGMSEKVLNHIFEPFYTTREGNRGLGLVICHFIITEIHKGEITAESREGEGSRFTISLPMNL